ncbi:MAG TPA: bifunctional diguanylate cyclase/phosphodiesterase [Mycobacteriales bacterium]|nr:bifunctional diguanylate cyclase/phosphodiesterase [Mycobacteriales bacterium]
MSPTGTLPPALRRLVRAAIGAAAASWSLSVVVGFTHPVPAWRLACVLALALAGDAVNLTVRIGAHRRTVAAGEVGLLLGFVIAPAWAVVAVTTPALAFWEVRRRERSAVQAAYNVAAATIATAAAGAVAAAAGVDGPGPGNWPGLALAMVVFSGLLGLLVSAAVARATGRRTLSVFRDGSVARVAIAGGSITVVAVLLAAWDFNRTLLLVLPALLVMGGTAMRRFLVDADELDALRSLDAATRALPGLDVEQLLSLVCTRAAALFGTGGAEVLVLAPVLRRFVGGPERSEGWTTSLPTDDADALRMHADVRPDDGGTLLVAPLHAGSEHLGALRVRVDRPTITAREQQLLAALATTAAGALLNAQMHLELVEHADALAAAAEDLHHRATHDELTGLGNRSQLLEAGDQLLATETRAVLMLLDLDHFKEVNDSLGHAAGDALLCTVAATLAAAAPEGSLVARLGGDEFAVLVPDSAIDGSPDNVARRLAARLREPVRVDGLRLAVEASVGIASAPSDATTVDDLLRCADIAMYQAKRSGMVVRRYNRDQRDTNIERLAVLAELQAGLPRGEIELQYQPKIDVATGDVYGVEALCRWHHPVRGLLMPGAFIPAAEHSSLIVALTEHVLERAVQDAMGWLRRGNPLQVAVNVSARNLLDDRFPNTVTNVLQRYGLPAHLLVLEVTETLALTELDTVETVLRRLRTAGVGLSVDDFGTGYSSLTFLHRVRVNEVKVDRSFVSQLPDSDDARSIVAATIDLAHRLGLSCVAEGVETEEQLADLHALGCDGAQGYLMSRPLIAADLETWVSERRMRHALVPAQRVGAR